MSSGWFIDDDGSVHEADIEWLAAEGITKGCDPPTNDRYCSSSSVTRGQMAAFLRRALALPGTSTDYFVDDNEFVFEGDINALAAARITKGFNPPTGDRFCPDSTVTREQMAAFLMRAFGFPPSADYDCDAALIDRDQTSLFIRRAMASEVPPDDRSPRLGGNHVSYGTTTTEQGSAVVHR